MKSLCNLLLIPGLFLTLISSGKTIEVPYFKYLNLMIDGKLDDEVYKSLKFIPFDSELAHSGKSDIAIVEGKSAKINAEQHSDSFAVFHDDKGLYLTVISPLPNNHSELTASCEMPDGLFEFFRCDDMLEIYIDPDRSGHDYYWFITNPQGNKTDLWAAADPDRSWNGVWETASQTSDDKWTAEFFFPYATFSRTALNSRFSLSLSRFKPQGMTRVRWGGEFRMPATWPERRLQTPSVCARQNINLLNMYVADSGIPNNGVITAEIEGLPENPALNAKWHIMRPMQTARIASIGPGQGLKDMPPHLRVKGGYSGAYGRLDYDSVAPTITRWVFHIGSGRFAHPREDRGLTMREAARIQSFSDDFHFCGTRNEQAGQIGNAVPPLFMEQLALNIIAALKGEAKED